MLQMKLATTLLGHGRTKHSPTLLEHIVDLFGGNKFRSGDEVTFIFAVFVVYNDEKFTCFEIFQSFFYGGELNVCHMICLYVFERE